MTTNLSIPDPVPAKSKTRQLEVLLPGIEAALIQGHGHHVIHEHIKNTVGLDLTFRTYKITLHRIRKRRDESNAKTVQRPTVPSVAKVTAPVVGSASPNSSPQVFEYDVKASVADFFS